MLISAAHSEEKFFFCRFSDVGGELREIPFVFFLCIKKQSSAGDLKQLTMSLRGRSTAEVDCG